MLKKTFPKNGLLSSVWFFGYQMLGKLVKRRWQWLSKWRRQRTTIYNKLTHFEFIFKPTIGLDITVPESGPYVLMVTYLHPERFIQRVFVTVGYQRGMLEILPCKYQFACRQFAMDDNKRLRAFELKATPEVNEVKIESSASAKIAVVSMRTFVF